MPRPPHPARLGGGPWLAALALVALAGCARPDPAPGAAVNPAVTECRAEARSSAEVRDFERQILVGNPTHNARVRLAQAEAQERLANDCLRRRGLSGAGGVEPVRPAWMRL